MAHVAEAPPRFVPHVDAARLAEVGRPRPRRVPVGVLRQELGAARDQFLGTGEQALPLLYILLQEAEQAHGVVVEDVVQVALVQVHQVGGGQQRADPFESDLCRLRVGEVPPGDAIGDHPGEAAAQGDGPAALVRDRVIGAKQQAAGAERAQHRHQRLRLADRRGVEPHVVQAGQRGDAGAGVGRVEPARRVRQDQLGVGIAFAVVAHLAPVVRIGQCGVAHQVQGDEPAALVRLLPHPLGQEPRRQPPGAGRRGRWRSTSRP